MISKLLEKVESASDKELAKIIREVASEYDEIILTLPVVPDEEFAFLLKIFSSNRALQITNVVDILLEVKADLIKYSSEQLARLVEKLKENAGESKNEFVRHAIADFIARACAPKVAFEIFAEMAIGSPNERHVAFVGFDVLRMQRRTDKSSEFYEQVMQKWNELASAVKMPS